MTRSGGQSFEQRGPRFWLFGSKSTRGTYILAGADAIGRHRERCAGEDDDWQRVANFSPNEFQYTPDRPNSAVQKAPLSVLVVSVQTRYCRTL